MSQAVKIVIVGHVDHGKSTLIGRLLNDTGSLPDGKLEELLAVSRKRGMPLEWSFVLDALQTERDQAITIDTTRVWFHWKGRRYAIIDAPGHREFVRNMLSGASEADGAVLVVDVVEGVSEQTKRHAQILQMLGVRQIIVVLNKLDATKYNEERYRAVASECSALLRDLGLDQRATIPVSARDGENVVQRSEKTTWYNGPTLMQEIATLTPAHKVSAAPLRFRVQDVYRIDDRRVAVGRIESGKLGPGERVVLTPMGSHATVRSIEVWNREPHSCARAGESIGVTFEEPVFVNRGDVVSHLDRVPVVTYNFRALCFWLDETPPIAGEPVTVKFGATSVRAVVSDIEGVTDSASLQRLSTEHPPRYSMVQLRLRSATLVPLDDHESMPSTSRMVMLRGSSVAAGGFVTGLESSSSAANLHAVTHLVSRDERERRNGHRGAVIWLTGLSGSGKSTLAMGLERRLFRSGAATYVLDGDNIRTGLNSDLGFSATDRSENIRRIGQVAALFADAGNIVITAFISPTIRDRAVARAACEGRFHEIYLKADVAACEARDPKGLYRKARAGEISDFTGVSAPYETPEEPEATLDTATSSIERCLDQLTDYVHSVTALDEFTRFKVRDTRL